MVSEDAGAVDTEPGLRPSKRSTGPFAGPHRPDACFRRAVLPGTTRPAFTPGRAGPNAGGSTTSASTNAMQELDWVRTGLPALCYGVLVTWLPAGSAPPAASACPAHVSTAEPAGQRQESAGSPAGTPSSASLTRTPKRMPTRPGNSVPHEAASQFAGRSGLDGAVFAWTTGTLHIDGGADALVPRLSPAVAWTSTAFWAPGPVGRLRPNGCQTLRHCRRRGTGSGPVDYRTPPASRTIAPDASCSCIPNNPGTTNRGCCLHQAHRSAARLLARLLVCTRS